MGREGCCKQIRLACARSVSALLGLPPLTAHTAQALGCSGSKLLCREPSEAGPGLFAPPRSKPLRLRHSGSLQRHKLSWACVLCPSQVRVAQVFGEHDHWDLSPLPSLLLSFLGVQLAPLLRQMVTVFEDNDLLFWVPDVLCQCWEVVLWNLLSVKMFFWWICEGESGLPVLFLCHLRTAPWKEISNGKGNIGNNC